MIIKDLELHFEVVYDYATDNQSILENIARQCRAKLMETIMLDRVELEQRNYCKVNRFEVELNTFELRIILDADINEQEVDGPLKTISHLKQYVSRMKKTKSLSRSI